MRTTRIYIAHPQINQPFILEMDVAHHLMHVLRANIGDTFVAFDGKGHEFNATIMAHVKKAVTVQLAPINSASCESSLQIHLIQALAKADKMDWIIQKAVELGVTEITPLITTYTDVKLDSKRQEKKHQHWQQIIIHACEQSGRSILPILHPIMTYKAWIEHIRSPTFLLHPLGTESLAQHIIDPKLVNLMIGPEGGFSDHEIKMGQKAGVFMVKLGSRILRTETAGLAAVSAMQVLWGDF